MRKAEGKGWDGMDRMEEKVERCDGGGMEAGIEEEENVSVKKGEGLKGEM